MDTPSLWAAAKLRIPAASSLRGDGIIHWDLAPDAPEILEHLRNPAVRQITLKFAAQTGKSTLLQAALGYLTQVRGDSIIYGVPSQQLQTSIPATRVEPLLNLSSIPHEKKQGIYNFSAGNYLKFVNLTQRKQLAESSARVILADEITECGELDFSWESDLAQRQKIFRQPLTIYASTPKNKGRDIDLHFSKSRQHVIEWECPHCAHAFCTDSESIKSKDPSISDPDRVLSEKLGCIECPACHALLGDDVQAALVKAQRWRCTTPERSMRSMGYEKKEWETTLKTFSEVLAEKLAVTNDPQGLRQWLCNSCASPPEESKAAIASEIKIGDFKRGEPPTSSMGWMFGADIQGDMIWVTCIAIYPDRIRQFWSQRIDRQKNDTESIVRAFKHLISDRPWSGTLPYLGSILDTGFSTAEALKIIARVSGMVGVKGGKIASGQSAKLIADGVHLLDTTYWQDTLQMLLNTGRIELPSDRWDLDITHIKNEVKRTWVDKGRIKTAWVDTYQGSHHDLRDCLRYAIYLASTKGLLNLRPIATSTAQTSSAAQAQAQAQAQAPTRLQRIPIKSFGKRDRW